MRPGSKGPLTAEEFKAKIAKIHAEGVARVRAILASEGYVGNVRAPLPEERNRARERKEERRRKAWDAWGERLRAALATGALFALRLDIKTTNPLNGLGRSRIAAAREKKKQRTLARERFAAALASRRGPEHPEAAKCAELYGAGSELHATARRLFRLPPPDLFPCRVLLRRVAPSSGLDPHDSLPASMKSACDGVADALGLASDRDPRVTWTYDQRRGVPGEYAVEIEVWPG